MKALFYGGAISSLAGLAMGMGMQPAAQPQPVGPDAQPIGQLVSNEASESVSYAAYDAPQPYVVATAYSPGPVYDLRPEAEAAVYEPAADVEAATDAEPAAEVQPVADVRRTRAIDRVLDRWSDAPRPAAAPLDVAAAGDTSPAARPAEMRTYASIDAVLNETRDEPGSAPTDASL